MGKSKKDKSEKPEEAKAEVELQSEDDYDQKLQFINGIATPMANKKLVKRLFKVIKKGKKRVVII